MMRGMQTDLKNLIGCAHKFGVPVRWLKDQAKAGKIPCILIGRRMLFNIVAVKKALLKLAAEGRTDE